MRQGSCWYLQKYLRSARLYQWEIITRREWHAYGLFREETGGSPVFRFLSPSRILKELDSWLFVPRAVALYVSRRCENARAFVVAFLPGVGQKKEAWDPSALRISLRASWTDCARARARDIKRGKKTKEKDERKLFLFGSFPRPFPSFFLQLVESRCRKRPFCVFFRYQGSDCLNP